MRKQCRTYGWSGSASAHLLHRLVQQEGQISATPPARKRARTVHVQGSCGAYTPE